MKRIACLLSCSLILLWAFHGVTAAQQLTGLTGPLDGDSDPLGTVTKAAKEKVDEVVPGVEEAVDDVINEVETSTDKVVKDVSEVAKDLAGTGGPLGAAGSDGTAGSGAEEPTGAEAPTSAKRELDAPGSSGAGKELAQSTNQSGTGSKDAPGAEPSETDKVAVAGDTIESALVKDEQLAVPEVDVDQSEESGLSSTGAQVLVLLVLACLLIAKRRRTRLAGTN